MNTSQALSAEVPAPAFTPRRTRRILLWIGQILLGALFIFGGVNKIFGLQPEVVKGFEELGFAAWFREVVGLIELTGGTLLLTPKLSGIGALLLASVMVGAIFTHLYLQPPSFIAVVPAVIGSILLVIARARRPETKRVVGVFWSNR